MNKASLGPRIPVASLCSVFAYRSQQSPILATASNVIDVRRSFTRPSLLIPSRPRHSPTSTTTVNMFSKALLLGAIAALATAQSTVLTFTNVPNPITDGQPQAITYATNDTTTVSVITTAA